MLKEIIILLVWLLVVVIFFVVETGLLLRSLDKTIKDIKKILEKDNK